MCPCTPAAGLDLGRWNAEHGARWNHFRTRLMRELVGDGAYMRGCEVQDGKRRADGRGRMALHDHFLVRTRCSLSLADVRRLAIAAGFGHEVHVVPVVPGSKREAYYVSKYVVKSADTRRAVPWVTDWVVLETGEVVEEVARAARYRTWSMSRDWGVTMADVKRAAAERWLAAAAARDQAAEDQALMLLGAEFGAVPVPTESPPLPS